MSELKNEVKMLTLNRGHPFKVGPGLNDDNTSKYHDDIDNAATLTEKELQRNKARVIFLTVPKLRKLTG